MELRYLLLSVLLLGLVCMGCKSTAGKARHLEPHAQAFTDAGMALSTLKALDAGDTNRAYQVTLLRLKDTMVQIRDKHWRDAVKTGDRQIAQAIASVILNYIERQKEILGQESGSDHCALEITKVLSVMLVTEQEKARLQVLHDYFSSRFVKERELYD